MIYGNDDELIVGLRNIAETHFQTNENPYREDEFLKIVQYIEIANITSILVKLAFDGDIVIEWQEETNQPVFKLSKHMRERHNKLEVEGLISSLNKFE